MRRILTIFLVLLLTVSTQAQQIVNRRFLDVSLSEALSQLAGQQTDYDIMFLYDELEDFRITTTVSRKTLPDAIRQMVGFYPPSFLFLLNFSNNSSVIIFFSSFLIPNAEYILSR